MSTLNVAETARLLQSWDRILILTHIRPDGDTVGCAAGLCQALRELGKAAYLLPNPGLTRFYAPYAAPYTAPADFAPDKVVSVDIATLNLLPDNARPYAQRVDLAIDHHPSFTAFARANIVRPEAAACGELMYDILRELGPISPETALPLYVAVSTDTGCFAYNNTTAQTHRVAAELMATGIDYASVNKLLFRTKTRKRLQLEGAMLENMEFYDNGRVVILSVPLALMERLEADESDAEELSALGGQIEGTDCAITMRELRPNVWKMSVRTGPRVNATQVCSLLGGGGHAAAAGCTVDAPWDQAKAQILSAVAQTVPDYAGDAPTGCV
jgi:phosphoesterase RecJ-like protein